MLLEFVASFLLVGLVIMEQGLPRKVTAVGTMGELGQLFTVYEKNWICKDCTQENYATRLRCFRCKKSKPAGNNYVEDPALQALQSGEVCQWQEAIDPTTYQIYYFNKQTNQTQWERPVELGPAPSATGWFGRGQSGSNAAQIYSDLNKKYLSQPAPKQKEFVDPKKYVTEGANEYNIWYGKYMGDYDQTGASKDAAADRCRLDEHAGWTKADQIRLGDKGKRDKKFFCLHFARGMCAKGADCVFYHRIPTPEDDAKTDELFDCFGRQRHSKHKDDMNGVGSFMKPCRTLFVGNLLKHKYEPQKALEECMWKHFAEWGELENVNVIYRLSIAFPRYRLRTSAEFAKEAMTCQALDHGEILSIRWAFDDPNPVAQDSIARADKDALAMLMKAKGISLEAAPFQYPAEYQLPAAKKGRTGEGEGVNGVQSFDYGGLLAQHPSLAYPDTDSQYSAALALSMSVAAAAVDGQSAQPVINADEYAAYCQQHYASYYAQAAATASSSSSSSSDEAVAVAVAVPVTVTVTVADTPVSAGGDWTEHCDPDSGATYYYNERTQESSWTAPGSSSALEPINQE